MTLKPSPSTFLGRVFMLCYHYSYRNGSLDSILFAFLDWALSDCIFVKKNNLKENSKTWFFWKWKAHIVTIVISAYIVGSDFPASFSLISKKWKEKVNPQKAWKKWTLYCWSEREEHGNFECTEQVSDVWVSTELRKTFLKWPYNVMRSFFHPIGSNT